MMIRESSATAREADKDQAASRTEAKADKTRKGVGRETDTTTREMETETGSVMQAAQEIEIGTVAATETNSTH